jgi:hypothetical protein
MENNSRNVKGKPHGWVVDLIRDNCELVNKFAGEIEKKEKGALRPPLLIPEPCLRLGG